MPKRGLAALAITTVALVLLLSFKTPDLPATRTATDAAIVAPRATAQVPTRTTRPGTTSAPATLAPSDPTAAPSAAAGGGAGTTVDGPVVSTRYGDVQVEVVVGGGQIQDVVALAMPTGRRSGQISQYSEPLLRSEALQAQSAHIDTVSGATYTSDAYAQSLQGALDQAGIS